MEYWIAYAERFDARDEESRKSLGLVIHGGLEECEATEDLIREIPALGCYLNDGYLDDILESITDGVVTLEPMVNGQLQYWELSISVVNEGCSILAYTGDF